MTRIIVLVNLKPGKSRAEYEAWATGSDLPTVRALGSIDGFDLFEATGLLGGGKPPYDYVEVIDVNDMEAFGRDAARAEMARIAGEFQAWADPVFILTRRVGTP